ncbi:MAG: Fic family protein [Prevotellaceae bacterium]|nr:Fic family protein [Prevotellaceae bacterium]
MTNGQRYTIKGLDEYLRDADAAQRERGEAWLTAIGLQQVDGLQPSPYLLQTARSHIAGDISMAEAKQQIESYYRSAERRGALENDRTEEADKVSARITEMIGEKAFSFSPTQLIAIHRRLFEGIYEFAGCIRDYNITKREWVLDGETVYYAGYDTIRETIDYDLKRELDFDYSRVRIDEAIQHLVRFCADLWQIHAFGEGNTRTTAVFFIKYLRTLGFKVVNDVFSRNSWYFRNALVRANYNNLQKGVTETTLYLERFFRNMLLGERHPLRNRELHVDWGRLNGDDAQSANNDAQSANTASLLSLKCKNCTLEEVALLRVIIENNTATQKDIAMEIGKSERTVKSITVRLQAAGILKRVDGRRYGHWELCT